MEFNRIYPSGMIYDLHLGRKRFTKVSDPVGTIFEHLNNSFAPINGGLTKN